MTNQDSTNPFLTPECPITSLYSSLDGLSVIQEVLADSTTDSICIESNHRSGLRLVLECITISLNHVLEILNERDERKEEYPIEHWNKLTTNQRETLSELIEDIVEANVTPQQIDSRYAARLAIARFEAETTDLSFEECEKMLAMHLITVTDARKEEYGDSGRCYNATRTWTLKGLRYELARQRFIESITGPCEKEKWPNDQSRTEQGSEAG